MFSKIAFSKSFSASGGQICPGGATILPPSVLYYIRYCKKEIFPMPKDIHTQDSSQQRASISDIVNLVESVSLT